ncbi:MAG: AAA family ATPase [Sphaerochaetaceae bacterium]
MLIEMTVKNFRSVKQAQTISFVAMKDSRLPKSKISEFSEKLKVLKTSVIIGPNGAGKSSFVRALDAISKIIQSEEEVENPLLSGFAGTAFAYSEIKGLPSEIEIKVLLPEGSGRSEEGQTVVAIYRLKADTKHIYEESLFYAYGNSKKLMFERKILPSLDEEDITYKYRFGKLYRGEKKKLIKRISTQRTFLAESAKKDGETCNELYNWIENNMIIVPMGAATGSEKYIMDKLTENPTWTKQLIDYLWSIDITDIRAIKIFNDKLYFIHTNVTQHYSSSFMAESLSLRRLCVMGIAFFESFTSDKTLVVDDFGMFLHPAIIKHVIEVFENSGTKRSQLLAVDCNPALLENDLLRRDGVWFAQKTGDGATEYYSLADFKIPGMKNKIRMFYENGAFGALPLTSEFSFVK